MSDKCILYDRECIDCGECSMCDINPEKVCNNCGICLEEDSAFRSIDIIKYMKEQEEK